MKKIYALAILPLISLNAAAVQGGNAVSWEKNDDTVSMECTGTIIGGQWVLTAAHCEQKAVLGVNTWNNNTVPVSVVHNHPEWVPDMNLDVSIWRLSSKVDTNAATFFSSSDVQAGQQVSMLGFGGTYPELNRAVFKVEPFIDVAPHRINLSEIGQGASFAGDSGAAYRNENSEIVGVLRSDDGIKLSAFSQFVLDTVNGWHYPTLANTNADGGSVTVTVQSLHQDVVADAAFTTGDATIVGGSCSGAQLVPFETCTYEISSNGYEGTLNLAEGQSVTINKDRTKPEPPKPDQGGDSGGSLGWFVLSLLGCAAAARRR